MKKQSRFIDSRLIRKHLGWIQVLGFKILASLIVSKFDDGIRAWRNSFVLSSSVRYFHQKCAEIVKEIEDSSKICSDFILFMRIKNRVELLCFHEDILSNLFAWSGLLSMSEEKIETFLSEES